MNDLEHRKRLLARTAVAAGEVRAACLAAKDPYAPLEEGGWNVHQVTAHSRDVDKIVYGLRALRTLAEDSPTFANFDGEAYMAANYDPRESLADLLDGL